MTAEVEPPRQELRDSGLDFLEEEVGILLRQQDWRCPLWSTSFLASDHGHKWFPEGRRDG